MSSLRSFTLLFVAGLLSIPAVAAAAEPVDDAQMRCDTPETERICRVYFEHYCRINPDCPPILLAQEDGAAARAFIICDNQLGEIVCDAYDTYCRYVPDCPPIRATGTGGEPIEASGADAASYCPPRMPHCIVVQIFCDVTGSPLCAIIATPAATTADGLADPAACVGTVCDAINEVCGGCVEATAAGDGPVACRGAVCDAINAVCHATGGATPCVRAAVAAPEVAFCVGLPCDLINVACEIVYERTCVA